MPRSLLRVVVCGGGTKYDCVGCASESLRSTLTYVSYASPRALSGTQARRSEDGRMVFVEDSEDLGLSSVVGPFCWMRAMKPARLSFADGVG